MRTSFRRILLVLQKCLINLTPRIRRGQFVVEHLNIDIMFAFLRRQRPIESFLSLLAPLRKLLRLLLDLGQSGCELFLHYLVIDRRHTAARAWDSGADLVWRKRHAKCKSANFLCLGLLGWGLRNWGGGFPVFVWSLTHVTTFDVMTDFGFLAN